MVCFCSVVWDAAIEVWCVPAPRRSGLSPAGFVLRDDDHCVSFRVFASSRETNAVVCPRFGRMPVERYVPIERYAPAEWCGMPRLECG
ncbi:MAG: hypothetical protein ACK6D4_14810, partial [Planctomyces sp.]